MIKLKNKIIDDYGRVSFTQEGLCNLLMKDIDILNLPAEYNTKTKNFNYQLKMNGVEKEQGDLYFYEDLDISIEEYHKGRQKNWFIPKEYINLNIEEFLLNKTKTNEEVIRVKEELILFEERNMINVLRLMIYLVDHFRANNILWGVGRGSSVSSYCLFLIGIHRINSLKFQLDYSDFFH